MQGRPEVNAPRVSHQQHTDTNAAIHHVKAHSGVEFAPALSMSPSEPQRGWQEQTAVGLRGQTTTSCSVKRG